MHYHKTGHEVTKDLVKLFAEQPTAVTIYYNNSVNGRFLENKRASDERVSDDILGCEPHNFTKHPLRAREAPDMFCDELKAFVPSDLNVVHFLREPADMIVSAYLYHKQEPPPEHWMNRTDPCERDEPMLRLMAKTIGIDYSAVEAVASGCERLLAKSGADNHYDALLALPTLEGLRLEAARSIVSSGVSAGADMLRMPANVLRLREAGVATYDILEPSWYNETLTNRSIFEITLRALGPDVESAIVTAKASSVYKRFRELQEDKLKSSAEDHITKDELTADERASYVSSLEKDATVGAILLKLRDIVIPDQDSYDKMRAYKSEILKGFIEAKQGP